MQSVKEKWAENLQPLWIDSTLLSPLAKCHIVKDMHANICCSAMKIEKVKVS